MKKNGIKNFIFSFALSLLAIIVVDKVFFAMPENASDNKKDKPSVKNISLFSKTEDVLLPQKQSNLKFSAIESLVSEKQIDSSKLPDLDTNVQSASIQPVIIYEPETGHNLKDTKQNQDTNIVHDTHTDIASASEIILEPSFEEVNIDNSNTIDAQVVYADISDTLNDEHKSTIHDHSDNKKEIVTALNNTSTQNDFFIPLTESKETLHEQIDVMTSASTAQIAMLEPTTLVNSIENFDEPEEKNIAEINLKQNETNLQETALESDDSPWVVAQGNRFAKNKIAQISAVSGDNVSLEEENKDAVIQDKADNATKNEKSETNENILAIHKDADANNLPSVVSNKDTENKKETEILDENDANISAFEPEKNTLLAPKPLLIPTEGSNTKLAYKMIQNLIIPLPDDIATDADIVPKLSSEPSKNNKDNRKDDSKDNNSQNSKELKEKDKESGLFKSISSWFSRDKEDKKDSDKSNSQQAKANKKSGTNKKKSGIFLFETSNKDTFDETYISSEAPEIMPAELKLSFQPNRAEISGHTLRWIHAFADNARDNSDIYIEIRIDGTNSFALQQKRLNLLSSIFANRGVDFRKVNIIFTAREPNSFIIRNLKFNNSEEMLNQDDTELYYQHW